MIAVAENSGTRPCRDESCGETISSATHAMRGAASVEAAARFAGPARPNATSAERTSIVISSGNADRVDDAGHGAHIGEAVSQVESGAAHLGRSVAEQERARDTA